MESKKLIESVGGVYSDILEAVEITMVDEMGIHILEAIQEAQKHAVIYFNRGYEFTHAVNQGIYDITERKYTLH